MLIFDVGQMLAAPIVTDNGMVVLGPMLRPRRSEDAGRGLELEGMSGSVLLPSRSSGWRLLVSCRPLVLGGLPRRPARYHGWPWRQAWLVAILPATASARAMMVRIGGPAGD